MDHFSFTIRAGYISGGSRYGTPYSSVGTVPEKLILPFVILFLLFILYTAYKVWRSLKKDEEEKENRRKWKWKK